MGDFVRKGNVSNAVPVHIRMKYIRPLLWVIKSIIFIIIKHLGPTKIIWQIKEGLDYLLQRKIGCS